MTICAKIVSRSYYVPYILLVSVFDRLSRRDLLFLSIVVISNYCLVFVFMFL